MAYQRATSYARWMVRTWLMVMGSVALAGGCKKPDEIRQYTIENPPPPQVTHRMLAAIVPDETGSDAETAADAAADAPQAVDKKEEQKQGPQAWFFKLVGPPQTVESIAPAFDQFVASVRTNKEGLPNWTLPDGWVEDPAGRAPKFGREATIRIGQRDSQLELAVSKLPMPKDRREGWLLGNINRWRAQMELPPLARMEFDEHTEKIKAADQTAIKVDFRGAFSGPPMAGMFGSKVATDRAKSTAAKDSNTPAASDTGDGAANKTTTSRLPFNVEVPEGWKPGRTAGGIRVAAYTVEDDDGRPVAEATVTPLGPNAGDLKANVDRWRGEIKLTPATAEELADQVKSIEIDGQRADYVHLVGPQDARPHEATLGVILRRPDRVWFFKLRGEAEIVEREKLRFEQFVQSVKFK